MMVIWRCTCSTICEVNWFERVLVDHSVSESTVYRISSGLIATAATVAAQLPFYRGGDLFGKGTMGGTRQGRCTLAHFVWM